MKPNTLFGTVLGLTLVFGLAAGVAPSSHALIEYSDSQRSTMIEMIEQLEERHYAKLEYDDAFSSEHLDKYIEALDGGKMFFLASDLEEFEQFRTGCYRPIQSRGCGGVPSRFIVPVSARSAEPSDGFESADVGNCKLLYGCVQLIGKR